MTYHNGAQFTWLGRQLVGASYNGKTMSFTYNDEGIRTSKTVEVNDVEITTNYYYSGSQLIAEETSGNITVYLYDASGSVIGMQYHGASYAEDSWDIYWYEKNLQGDVVAIYNASGTKLVSYTYDAWGNTTVAYHNGGESTSVVNNRFTYRGYYYDYDLGLYYLQSRYYDSNTSRFISADNYLNANGDIIGFNSYAYCSNNPVMGYDPMGTWNWGTFLSGANLLAIGITAMATAATILSCGAAAPIMVAVASVTFAAGALTAVNGVAEVIEAGTDYNFVRDGVMNGNEELYETYKNITKTVAEVGTAICGSYYAAKGGNVCFVAGTMVVTALAHVAIEEIEVGDMVWACDSETGEIKLKPVVNVFVNEASELVHVYVNGEEIVCTNEHPFYSPVKGWTAACKLRAGDVLVTLNGEYVIVEWVQHEILESPVTVYNFEVADFHTYFVGDDDGILVHNKCKPKSIGRSGKQARLRELLNDDKLSSALKGEIKRDLNMIARGQRTTIRVPKGYHLSHRIGFSAKNGFGYQYSDLQVIVQHIAHHKVFGR